MGSSQAEHAEVIAGSPAACLEALLDFESYPEWQTAVQDVTVREDGAVEFRVDAKVRTIHYVLRYHAEPPSRLWWEYVEGDARDVSGEYLLDDLGDGTTRATYRLDIDPGRFVPGPVRKLLTEGVMRSSVRDLKRRVEG
jgi:uncharacterized membrane protein